MTDVPDVPAIDPAKRAEAAAALQEDHTIDEWARRFALLSDPNRLRLLFCLHRAPGIAVSDLAAAVGMSDTSVSHALRLLRSSGWVSSQRSGRAILYSLADDTIHDILHRLGATHSDESG
ncbi:transcriptional regulator [Actinobacteria bacterium YIM 96077]|uniref:Transcriptional regulator n=1 Tax=Phytoactinopolyspora halophila TaxID=1981511 RepID=A0A329R2D9_9ACTN|nr:metalloregulator ArsR/SmtB family transcription factor [Phytoactinopolyspora halophila]AYY12026.1 transcriptional regulator [Actinobacteria bacterium YIM 96077]RAW18740.1 transcriptional regulator [Phytoactinopolyspora halophila]